MKVYIVWAYDSYYPSGPGDIQGVFADAEAAENLRQGLVETTNWDHIQITEETVQ